VQFPKSDLLDKGVFPPALLQWRAERFHRVSHGVIFVSEEFLIVRSYSLPPRLRLLLRSAPTLCKMLCAAPWSSKAESFQSIRTLQVAKEVFVRIRSKRRQARYRKTSCTSSARGPLYVKIIHSSTLMMVQTVGSLRLVGYLRLVSRPCN
jgi:hypothetical protein